MKKMKKVIKKYKKIKVCAECQSVGITYYDCICNYTIDYPIIELEFEICKCCGRYDDGQPADTEFNKKQWENYDKAPKY